MRRSGYTSDAGMAGVPTAKELSKGPVICKKKFGVVMTDTLIEHMFELQKTAEGWHVATRSGFNNSKKR